MGHLHVVTQSNFYSFAYLLVETLTRNVRVFPPGLSLWQSFSRGCLSDSVVRSINVHIATNCIAPRVTRKIKQDITTIILGALCDQDNLEYHNWFSFLLVFLFVNPWDWAILLWRRVISVTASCMEWHDIFINIWLEKSHSLVGQSAMSNNKEEFTCQNGQNGKHRKSGTNWFCCHPGS